MTSAQSCAAVVVLSVSAAVGPVFARIPGTGAEDLRHEIRRATSPIVIDGVLDEPAWADAAPMDLPYEYEPGDNVTPPVRTEGLLTFDSTALYVAFRVYDPRPEEVRAHLMDRDAIETFVQDDHVIVTVDTFNDQRRAFEFRVNPLGVQADALLSEVEGTEDFSWDIIWDSAGRRTDFGYMVEIAIPLNQIRFPDTDEVQTWGIGLVRSYPRSIRYQMASHRIERDRVCVICQMNQVHGFESLERGLNLELDPTLTITRTDEVPPDAFPDGPLLDGDTEYDLGLSIRWGVTPSMTANVALNPDFSQVEADVAQLAVNERFALFFPERRPFFVEGVDLFDTPVDAVFTRTVADPDWGAKLTGKLGSNALGFFFTGDAVNNIVVPGRDLTRFASSADGLLDAEVLGSVVRYRRDVASKSTLGVLYAGREGGDAYFNRVGGLDLFVQPSRTDQLRVQWLRSETRYPDSLTLDPGFGDQPAGTFEGDALLLDYYHYGRAWTWQARHEAYDSTFRADSGFVPRVNIATTEGNLTRIWYGDDDSGYTTINTGGALHYTEDDSGATLDRRGTLFANLAGPLQSFVQLSASRRDERFLDVMHTDLDELVLDFNIQPGRAAWIALEARVGDTIDFESNVPADLLEVATALELKPGRHVNARLSHTLRRINPATIAALEANLSELRLYYHVNVRTFVRLIAQRLDVERGPAVDVEELSSQLLFSYKVNPQTVALAGYSESREGAADFDLTQLNRTFFVKLGYAWLPEKRSRRKN